MYEKVKLAKAPKRSRKGESRFEKTPAWPKLKRDLEKGFDHAYCLIIRVSDAEKKEFGISRLTVRRHIQRYLKENGLTQYRVDSFQEDSEDCVQVRYVG